MLERIWTEAKDIFHRIYGSPVALCRSICVSLVLGGFGLLSSPWWVPLLDTAVQLLGVWSGDAKRGAILIDHETVSPWLLGFGAICVVSGAVGAFYCSFKAKAPEGYTFEIPEGWSVGQVMVAISSSWGCAIDMNALDDSERRAPACRGRIQASTKSALLQLLLARSLSVAKGHSIHYDTVLNRFEVRRP